MGTFVAGTKFTPSINGTVHSGPGVTGERRPAEGDKPPASLGTASSGEQEKKS